MNSPQLQNFDCGKHPMVQVQPNCPWCEVERLRQESEDRFNAGGNIAKRMFRYKEALEAVRLVSSGPHAISIAEQALLGDEDDEESHG